MSKLQIRRSVKRAITYPKNVYDKFMYVWTAFTIALTQAMIWVAAMYTNNVLLILFLYMFIIGSSVYWYVNAKGN